MSSITQITRLSNAIPYFFGLFSGRMALSSFFALIFVPRGTLPPWPAAFGVLLSFAFDCSMWNISPVLSRFSLSFYFFRDIPLHFQNFCGKGIFRSFLVFSVFRIVPHGTTSVLSFADSATALACFCSTWNIFKCDFYLPFPPAPQAACEASSYIAAIVPHGTFMPLAFLPLFHVEYLRTNTRSPLQTGAGFLCVKGDTKLI